MEGGGMSSKLTAVLALASLALGVAATSAVGADEVKTKAKITDGGPSLFEGKVTSKNDKCVAKRKVKLMYSETAPQKGYTDGDVVGSDKTDRKGRFEIPGDYFAGYYWLAIAQVQLAHQLICRGFTGIAAHY
jgi:hypothetical protein